MLATALLGSTAACNKSSPSNPPRDAAQPREMVDAGTASSGTKAADAASAAAAAGCKSDDDCQTWSSYCQEAPCVCRVYARDEGEPRCISSAGNVACFVDPCMKKAAACQDGRCVLVMQPSN